MCMAIWAVKSGDIKTGSRLISWLSSYVIRTPGFDNALGENIFVLLRDDQSVFRSKQERGR